jgi:hypothetical protein
LMIHSNFSQDPLCCLPHWWVHKRSMIIPTSYNGKSHPLISHYHNQMILTALKNDKTVRYRSSHDIS